MPLAFLRNVQGRRHGCASKLYETEPLSVFTVWIGRVAVSVYESGLTANRFFAVSTHAVASNVVKVCFFLATKSIRCNE